MSQCLSPDCGSKNFLECMQREISTGNTCEVQGSSGVAAAGCVRNGTGSDTWTRDASVCTGKDSQDLCEKILGCEWSLPDGSVPGNPLKKVCQVSSDTMSCSSSDILTDDSIDGRYKLIEPDTYGCDQRKCDYTSQKKLLEPGVCEGNILPDSSSDAGITCSNFTTKNTCIGSSNNRECIWVPNDEGYCGYNRIIESIFDASDSINAGKTNIHEIISHADVNAGLVTNDPCLKIQNPGRAECEENGCIWDINGDRKVLNNYNSSNENYYDIYTSGLCRFPQDEKCMEYFCSRHSNVTGSDGDEKNDSWEIPDNKCRSVGIIIEGSEGSNQTCVPNDEQIVSHKTPGLIDFLPNNFPSANDYPYHSPRSSSADGWKHGETVGSNTLRDDIDNLNTHLAFTYTDIDARGGADKSNVMLSAFKDIYKNNCELNIGRYSGDYSSLSGTGTQNSIPVNNKYDHGSDSCRSGLREVDFGSLCSGDNRGDIGVPSTKYYHKDIGGDNYIESKNCKYRGGDTRDTADIEITSGILYERHENFIQPDGSQENYDEYSKPESGEIIDFHSGARLKKNEIAINTLANSMITTQADELEEKLKKDVRCRNVFYTKLEFLKRKIDVFSTNIPDDIENDYEEIISGKYIPINSDGVTALQNDIAQQNHSSLLASDDNPEGLFKTKCEPTYNNECPADFCTRGACTQADGITVCTPGDGDVCPPDCTQSCSPVDSIDQTTLRGAWTWEQYLNNGMNSDEWAGILNEGWSNINNGITKAMLNISFKLKNGLINYEEYKNELAVFILSIQTSYDEDSGTPNDSLNCKFDVIGGGYVNKGNEEFNLIHHKIIEDSTIVDNRTSGNISNYLGKGASDARASPNVTLEHSVKDIVFNSGKALVTLFHAGGVQDMASYNVEGATITFGNDNYLTVPSGTEYVMVYNGDYSDDSEKLFHQNKQYSITPGSFKEYIGGLVEFEIDGVDPGYFGTDQPPGSNLYENNIIFDDDATYIESGGAGLPGISDVSLKSVYLKDISIDIYFNSNIDGLYKVNDIISINDVDDSNNMIQNIFNPNLNFQNKKYQRISNVDLKHNKITVENVQRRYSGKYFVGREEMQEMMYYAGSHTNCLISNTIDVFSNDLYDNIISGSNLDLIGMNNIGLGVTGTPSDETTIPNSCDISRKTYNHCFPLGQSECTTDEMCQYHTEKCIPNISTTTEDDSYFFRDGTNNAAGVFNADNHFRCDQKYLDLHLEETHCPATYIKDGEDNLTSIQLRTEIMVDYSSDGNNLVGLYITNNNDNTYNINGLLDKMNTFITTAELIIDNEDILMDWRISYISVNDDSFVKRDGKIGLLNIEGGTKNISINQSTSGDQETSENIIILSIMPPHINDLNFNPSLNDDGPYNIVIENYVRKDITFYPLADGGGLEVDDETSLTKKQCDFNNGLWEHGCNAAGATEIHPIDVCERTGFKFNDNKNICIKEVDTSQTDGSLVAMCSAKTVPNDDPNNWDTNNNTTNENYDQPCSVCNWVKTTGEQYCASLPRLDCLMMTKDTCGNNRPGASTSSGGLISTSNACEYYNHNMETRTITPTGQTESVEIPSHSDFNCGDVDSSSGGNCEQYTTMDLCTNVDTGCEWQCPYASGTDHAGYIVRLGDTETGDTETDPTPTALNTQSRDNYYTPESIHVVCDTTGYVSAPSSGTSEYPKAQCIQNRDTNTYDNHAEILDFIGCVKTPMCKNPEYTPILLQEMFLNDPNSVPGVFITNGELDLNKMPDDGGGFNCPLPSLIIADAEAKTGWDEGTCCRNTGLCTGNDNVISDINCPEGQEIKMTYYTGNDELSPHIGTTVEECCSPPETPTITVPLDADYNELIVSDGSLESETFRENFINDLVTILNDSPDITVTITANMIEIVNIGEGSIVVTFKLLKDTNGEVVLKDQITRTLTAGTMFERVGAVSNAEPTFKPYDPKGKYFYYSEKFKKGITLEELVISIFITISLCLFCLVILGMLFK